MLRFYDFRVVTHPIFVAILGFDLPQNPSLKLFGNAVSYSMA